MIDKTAAHIALALWRQMNNGSAFVILFNFCNLAVRRKVTAAEPQFSKFRHNANAAALADFAETPY